MDIHCHHCGSLEIEYKFHVQQHPLYQCPLCQLAFLHPQPTDEQLTEIYNEHYFIGSQSEKKQEYVNRIKKETAQLYLNELVAYTRNSNLRLLEIGCGNGDFILAAQEEKFEVKGIEINEFSFHDKITWKQLHTFLEHITGCDRLFLCKA